MSARRRWEKMVEHRPYWNSKLNVMFTMLQPIDLSPKSHYLKMETKCLNPNGKSQHFVLCSMFGRCLEIAKFSRAGWDWPENSISKGWFSINSFPMSRTAEHRGFRWEQPKTYSAESHCDQLVQGKCVFIIVHFLLSSLLNVINSSHPMFVILLHRGDSIRVARF